MKLLKGVFPKIKLMPKMTDLTGIKKGSLGLPSMRTKRKKTSWRNMFKDV